MSRAQNDFANFERSESCKIGTKSDFLWKMSEVNCLQNLFLSVFAKASKYSAIDEKTHRSENCLVAFIGVTNWYEKS